MRREKGKYEKKMTRRAVLKTGVAASIGGLIGGGLGKGYDSVVKFYDEKIGMLGNKIVEIDKKVDALPKYRPEKAAKEVREYRGKFWNKVFGRSEKEQQEWLKGKKISTPKKYLEKKVDDDSEVEDPSRRSFLRYLLGVGHKNPVKTGAIAGAAYGASSHTVKNYGKYHNQKEIAVLKDENTELKERVGELEKKVNGPYVNSLIAISVAGIIISVLVGAVSISGYSVLGSSRAYSFGSVIGFFFFFTLLLVGVFVKMIFRKV